MMGGDELLSACKKMVTILFALPAYFSLIYVHHRLMSLNLSHSTTRIPNLGKMRRHSYKLQRLWRRNLFESYESCPIEKLYTYRTVAGQRLSCLILFGLLIEMQQHQHPIEPEIAPWLLHRKNCRSGTHNVVQPFPLSLLLDWRAYVANVIDTVCVVLPKSCNTRSASLV
ncbi:hypothetical protein H5410_029572 [Solanum commersonii]|uniref:Uncharacterized protein n=1 Tax=Solanum commersonii TaxID=4109 RepID=A0A9J5YDC0_SOLCO|nr:hypothetical protein H5410_029572 [Solanum commersonii]